MLTFLILLVVSYSHIISSSRGRRRHDQTAGKSPAPSANITSKDDNDAAVNSPQKEAEAEPEKSRQKRHTIDLPLSYPPEVLQSPLEQWHGDGPILSSEILHVAGLCEDRRFYANSPSVTDDQDQTRDQTRSRDKEKVRERR
jgi:hypothetical protein